MSYDRDQRDENADGYESVDTSVGTEPRSENIALHNPVSMEIVSEHGNRSADAIDSSIVVSGGSGDADEREASHNPSRIVVNSVFAEVTNHLLFCISNLSMRILHNK